jgi:hypothetical protein
MYNLGTERQYMKKALVLLAAVSFNCFAYTDEPFKEFDTTHNAVNRSNIVWLQVPNVDQACEKMSLQRGGGGFGYAMQACSFWDKTPQGTTCTIITGPTTNLTVLGHETRHCFQGNFH